MMGHTLAQPQFLFFFFNDTATTEIYTLSLHDALPICGRSGPEPCDHGPGRRPRATTDRKSTRLNSSHGSISYDVFCLKKQNQSSLFTLGPPARPSPLAHRGRCQG